jgi:hypothetical protein
MPAAHQIDPDLLARPGQIPGRLERRRRDRDRRQRAGHQLPQQQIGVAAVGLVAISRRARGLRRSDHLTVDPRHDRRPVQAEPGRARLVARAHRPRQPSQPPHDRLHRPSIEPLPTQLARHHIQRRGVRRARVGIHRGPCHRSGHGRTSFVWGQPEPLSGQSNPRINAMRSGLQRPGESSSIGSRETSATLRICAFPSVGGPAAAVGPGFCVRDPAALVGPSPMRRTHAPSTPARSGCRDLACRRNRG